MEIGVEVMENDMILPIECLENGCVCKLETCSSCKHYNALERVEENDNKIL